MAKQKFYVVWHGVTPGIYRTWTDCKLQINGFQGAVYKSFDSKEEAERAYNSSPYAYINKGKSTETSCDGPLGTGKSGSGQPVARHPINDVPSYRNDTVLPLPMQVQAEALAVDAACSGNPGPMEYQAIYLRTGQQVFHFGPIYGTNNIGEFLAIVHALALLDQKGLRMPVYSDSRNALLWVKQKKCKTKLERTPRTEELFRLIERAEQWLRTHPVHVPLIKWETQTWGEIPADFGRK